MNKQSWRVWIISGSLLILHSLNALASGIDPHDILKKHYLSKFIDTTPDDTDNQQASSSTGEELTPYALNDRMTPLRTRSLLLNYICPECTGKKNPQNKKPVNVHSDIWLDSQVFQTEGKAHIYEAAFPGMSLMGEVYGAYHLVTGATQDLQTLKSRQRLIREMQTEQWADQFRTPIKEVNQHLTQGLAIFDRKHPFNNYPKHLFFLDETLLDKVDLFPPPFSENLKKNHVQSSLSGSYAKQMAYLPFVSAFVLAVSIPANLKLMQKTRNWELFPWQGYKNFLHNSLIIPLKIGAYAPSWAALTGLIFSGNLLYEQYHALKNAVEVLSHELIAIKPFLEALYSFHTIKKSPFFNFTLSEDEASLFTEVVENISQLDSNPGHFYHPQVQKVASSLRRLLLIRGTIIKYLTNIAKLDFYINTAEGTRNPDLWSFVEYEEKGNKPELMAQRLWNPILPAEKAVPSDACIGGRKVANIVLTGANASGKSTFLRSLGINAIFMAQTLGVAAAGKFRLTPFTHFASLMEKRDSNGRSSYETEVDAVVEAWAINSKLSENHKSLILADELFRTTNHAEGTAASKLLVRNFGSLPQVSLIVSTHFKKMTELADEYPERFSNKHMSVEIDDNHQITKMNYQLTDGPSPSANAIQLFDQNFRKNYPELFQSDSQQ